MGGAAGKRWEAERTGGGAEREGEERPAAGGLGGGAGELRRLQGWEKPLAAVADRT
jgi:hypothetical protein